MKINLKARLKNKVFIISVGTLVVSILYKILSLCGVVPSVSESEILEVFSYLVDALSLMGIIVDPTTKGVSDSERAMTYYTENDVREIE